MCFHCGTLSEVLPSGQRLGLKLWSPASTANSVLRTQGGLARSKETNAPDIRGFGQGLGGPRKDTILVGLLVQDGVIMSNFLFFCLLCPLRLFKTFHSASRTEFPEDNSDQTLLYDIACSVYRQCLGYPELFQVVWPKRLYIYIYIYTCMYFTLI